MSVLLLLLTAHLSAPRLVAQSATAPPQSGDVVERKVAADTKIRVRNAFGNIVIKNWDRDTVRAGTSTDAAKVSLSVTAAKSLILSVTPGRGGRRAELAVSLPRGVVIETVDAAGNVTATNIDGSVVIAAGGDINAVEIGGDLVAKAASGEINVSRVRGLVDLSIVNGGVNVRDASGDVRVASINGGVRVACVEGRVEVGNVNGSIMLADIGGDVDATTSNSSVEFTGTLRPGRRYRLKSHNGTIEMRLPSDSIGFTATLSSYGGGIETGFPLAVQTPFSTRRLIGRYREGGDGRTSIYLDSFGGGVKLSKEIAATKPDCRPPTRAQPVIRPSTSPPM